eukprot:CAMPEP_0170617412 /NCGR_PEP_ID=MMETSP0224-20130122/26408_1 /TAXON_ID=285029 /ORGANISM="Togula jolla, Strain CCCM 725" /LENGTH=541 /DNA_ID=CAMNT_0010943311 /DNA_START=157 /DNA_END=1782 /DNA_ORIENTATION=-
MKGIVSLIMVNFIFICRGSAALDVPEPDVKSCSSLTQDERAEEDCIEDRGEPITQDSQSCPSLMQGILRVDRVQKVLVEVLPTALQAVAPDETKAQERATMPVSARGAFREDLSDDDAELHRESLHVDSDLDRDRELHAVSSHGTDLSGGDVNASQAKQQPAQIHKSRSETDEGGESNPGLRARLSMLQRQWSTMASKARGHARKIALSHVKQAVLMVSAGANITVVAVVMLALVVFFAVTWLMSSKPTSVEGPVGYHNFITSGKGETFEQPSMARIPQSLKLPPPPSAQEVPRRADDPYYWSPGEPSQPYPTILGSLPEARSWQKEAFGVVLCQGLVVQDGSECTLLVPRMSLNGNGQDGQAVNGTAVAVTDVKGAEVFRMALTWRSNNVSLVLSSAHGVGDFGHLRPEGNPPQASMTTPRRLEVCPGNSPSAPSAGYLYLDPTGTKNNFILTLHSGESMHFRGGPNLNMITVTDEQGRLCAVVENLFGAPTGSRSATIGPLVDASVIVLGTFGMDWLQAMDASPEVGAGPRSAPHLSLH